VRFSLHEVRSRGQRDPDTTYDRVFTRHVSVLLTWVLAPLGTPPNLISGVNFFVGTLGCVLIASGPNVPQVLAGVGLIHLYAVLDSVDGELARLLERRSLRGLFLEDLSAYAMMAAFPVAVGAYLTRETGSALPIAVGVTYAVLGRNAMPAVRRAIAQSPPTSEGGDPVVSTRHRAPGWMGIVDRTILHQTNIRVALTSLVLVEVVTGRTGDFVALPFFAYMLALFAREAGIVAMTVRGTLLDQEWERLRGAPPPSPESTQAPAPLETREAS
jgi:hypothetical protein